MRCRKLLFAGSVLYVHSLADMVAGAACTTPAALFGMPAHSPAKCVCHWHGSHWCHHRVCCTQGILDCNTFTLPKEQLSKLRSVPQNPTAFEPERAYSTHMS